MAAKNGLRLMGTALQFVFNRGLPTGKPVVPKMLKAKRKKDKYVHQLLQKN